MTNPADDEIDAAERLARRLAKRVAADDPEPLSPQSEIVGLLELDSELKALKSASRVGETPIPKRVAHFEVIRPLGRGGFGLVMLAHDVRTGRYVALKLPRVNAGICRQRLIHEARAAAGLDHPNIVPLLETGEVDGVAYIATTYVVGPTLAEWLQHRRTLLPVAQAVDLMLAIADAVAYAHERGILHRDLKPGNILLDSARGSDAEPCPRVVDFGLARILLFDGESLTPTGQSLGTPPYAAPEQLLGAHQATAAIDVFALGVMLFELLTGRPPDASALFDRRNPFDVRKAAPEIDARLRDLIAASLTFDPGMRPRDAGAFRDELRDWRDGKRSTWRRFVRWWNRLTRPAAAFIRRRPLVSIAALVCVAGLTASAIQLAVMSMRDRNASVSDAVARENARPILQRLESGEEVDWIEAARKAPFWRLRFGEGNSWAAPSEDGLTVYSTGMTLVEFVPETPKRRMHVDLELRHDFSFSNEYSGGGVYWNAQVFGNGPERLVVADEFSIDDHVSRLDATKLRLWSLALAVLPRTDQPLRLATTSDKAQSGRGVSRAAKNRAGSNLIRCSLTIEPGQAVVEPVDAKPLRLVSAEGSAPLGTLVRFNPDVAPLTRQVGLKSGFGIVVRTGKATITRLKSRLEPVD